MTGFVERLAEAWPEVERRDRTIVVAVSGGADSVALLHGLADLTESRRLIVAHFNHGLRGAASDEDAAYVAKVAAGLKIACEIGVAKAGEIPASGAEGLEAAARDARYRFLTSVAATHGARYVAIGHTRNDQVETVLYRLIRGTGIDGLAGIPHVRALNDWTTVVRPMLNISREVVLEYLVAHGIQYRHDASNDDCEMLRNRIRHELLPLIEKRFNPRAADSIARLARLADEAQEFVEKQTAELFDATIRFYNQGAVVDAKRLAEEAPFVVRSLLMRLWREADWPRRNMSLTRWELLETAVRLAAINELRAFDLPGPIRVSAAEGKLRLERLS